MMSIFAKTKSALAVALLLALATPAMADLASDKTVVDAAKTAGIVGEQADGYLGLVKGSADGPTTAAVNEINAARGDVYAQTAAKTGVSSDAAGDATGAQLIAKMPGGEYYKAVSGGWAKK